MTNRVIALEVELKEKAPSDYRHVGSIYDLERVDKVIWLVRTAGAAVRIQSHMGSGSREKAKHNFVALPQFLEQGWQATIAHGPDTGNKLVEVLENPPRTAANLVLGKFHLNVAKSPHKSKRSIVYTAGDIFH